jgi:hypothetical protein
MLVRTIANLQGLSIRDSHQDAGSIRTAAPHCSHKSPPLSRRQLLYKRVLPSPVSEGKRVPLSQ